MAMSTIQQSSNNSSFEELTIQYLEKKGVVRFSEFLEWLSTAMKNPPTKSNVSVNLDKLAEEGKIFSWNKKGARYLSPICDISVIKDEIYKFIEKQWLKQEKINFKEIEENLDYPPQIIYNALLSLVSEGKILNTTNEDNNIVYYRLPPVHSSIKIGLPILSIFSALYFLTEKLFSTKGLFLLSFSFLSVIIFLWYKKR